MKKHQSHEAGSFNPRIFFAFILCSLALGLAMLSFATPVPTSGTLSTANPSLSYTDSNGAPPNVTPVATGTPNCGPTGALCSTYNLTIDPSVGVPAGGYVPAQYQITLQWSWATSAVDYDIFVEDSTNAVVAKNTSTADPSTIVLPTNITPGTYQLIVVLSTGAPIPYTGTITLSKVPFTAGGPGLCTPPNSLSCAPARFQSYPAGTGQSDNAGEPSLGVDWNPNVATLQHDKVNTGGVALFTSGSNEYRINFDDCAFPAIYNWQDVSALTDQTFVLSDPIGFVDHYSSIPLGLTYPPVHTPGRAFAIDLIGGQGDSLGAYSDDDFNTSANGGNGGPGAGPDHETLGAGPYAGAAPTGASYPSAASPGALHGVYYCSQNIAAEAQCSRSDNGGVTFGPSVPIFNPAVCTGGIHGHVKVAPDGTVYVPNSACGTTGTAGVAVSIDNGLNWVENNVPNSTSSQDPYVGIGQNNVGKPASNLNGTNTIYLGYTDGDHHPKVAFSGDRGATWSTPVDLGVPYGVTHAVFPIAAAGDDNRAAIGFVGTGDGISTDLSTCDPYGATLNCANAWHLFIATTYDGGQNWITTDATPNDPIQTGVVCLAGTTCMAGRNLLDFNDMAIDSEGRILVGYADGCVNCSNTYKSQSSASHGTVTRQSGGRRLFQHFDPVEPAAPAAPQLVSATRQGTGALIVWLEPDNGGSPITGYNIYRGTTTGGEGTTPYATVTGATTNKYVDPAPPVGNAYYYVTALNARGESTHCAELTLTVGLPPEDVCMVPGLTKLTDPAGDTNATVVLNGVTTPVQPGMDLLAMHIAQPYAPDGIVRLTFTINTDANPASAGTPGSGIYSSMKIGALYKGVRMRWATATTPVFESYTPSPNNSGGVDGRFAAAGSVVAAEPTSNYDGPNGVITIVVKASDLGLTPSDVPGAHSVDGGFNAGSTVTTDVLALGAGVTDLFDEMPNGLGYTGSYTVNSNQFCRPNTAPVAVLSATPMSGNAPLLVNFSGAGSYDPDTAAPPDTIASYTFYFGDGTSVGPQASATAMHTYNASGDYTAKLVVTDSRGKSSTNVAQQVISVIGGAPPVARVVSRKTHGSAGTYDIQMPLLGTVGIEDRTGKPSTGSHNLVLFLQNNVSSVGSATATATTSSGTTMLPTPTYTIGSGPQANQISVNLTGVPNASHVFLTLHTVADTAGNSGDIVVPADFLLGDVNANRSVTNADVTAVKGQVGGAASSTNFRDDVNANGVVSNADVTLTKGSVGASLP